MQPLRFATNKLEPPFVAKAIKYAMNPPKGQATHYNTLGGMLSEYMQYDGEWFLNIGGRWSLLDREPVYKTKVGDVEVKPVEKTPEELKVKYRYHEPTEPEYYPKGQRYD